MVQVRQNMMTKLESFLRKLEVEVDIMQIRDEDQEVEEGEDKGEVGRGENLGRFHHLKRSPGGVGAKRENREEAEVEAVKESQGKAVAEVARGNQEEVKAKA